MGLPTLKYEVSSQINSGHTLQKCVHRVIQMLYPLIQIMSSPYKNEYLPYIMVLLTQLHEYIISISILIRR